MNTSVCGASSRQLGMVLIVDPDVVFREFEARTLTDRGYAVLKATGGGEALRLAGQNANIHLLLTGSSIHEFETLELCQQFKTAHARAPILLVLGAFERFDERFNSLGRVGVMAKPFALDELIDNVDRLLAEVAGIPFQQPQGPLVTPTGSTNGAELMRRRSVAGPAAPLACKHAKCMVRPLASCKAQGSLSSRKRPKPDLKSSACLD